MSTRFGCGRPVACGRCSGCGCCDLADRRKAQSCGYRRRPGPAGTGAVGRFSRPSTGTLAIHSSVAVGLLARRGAATLPHMVRRRLAVPLFVITVVLSAPLGVSEAAAAVQPYRLFLPPPGP